MKAKLIPILIGAFLFCSTASSTDSKVQLEIRSINVTDGISQDEAFRLATSFFHYLENVGCGGIGAAVSDGDNWHIPTYYGFAGREGAPILISKSKGSITIDNKVCVESPAGLLKKNYEANCLN